MKKIYFALLFCLTFFILALSISAYDIAVQDENGNIYYHNSNKFYLPSHISPSEVEFLVEDGTTFFYTDENGNDVLIDGRKVCGI